MQLLSHSEVARRLGVDHDQIGYWCDPRNGLVRLAAHPWISSVEFVELAWIADRRKGASGRFAHEAERLQLDDLERFVVADLEMNGRKSTGHVRTAYRHLRDHFGGISATRIPALADE